MYFYVQLEWWFLWGQHKKLYNVSCQMNFMRTFHMKISFFMTSYFISVLNLDVGFFCIKIYPYNNQQYEGYCSWDTTNILRPTKMFRLEFFSVEIRFYVNGGRIDIDGVLFIFISQFYKVIHSYFDLLKYYTNVVSSLGFNK